jgi:DNA repair exonuclease SbcCD ATPase subunit
VKIERLVIAGFGRLRDLSLKFGDGLTVIYGPNEAGKSTIVECIVRMLFGFPESQYNKARTKYEPRAGGPFRATLAYELDDHSKFEVTRDFARADVPTETVDAVTRRPLPALTGNKVASPGADALAISIDVYRAAAVLSADDAEMPESASHALGERLAEIIGSAGAASAAQAMDHLKEARDSVGLRGANSQLGKATREADEAEAELARHREDHTAFSATIREQAELSDRAHELTARRSRCAAALAAVRLRGLRSRITEAAEAKRRIDAALDGRGDAKAKVPSAFERRDDIDSAAEAFRAAQQSETDATARSAARAADRTTLQHDVDVAGNELIEKRAAVARFDGTLAAHEAAAKDRPAISADTLAALEREADDADAAESRARTLDTDAAIARQRQRPSPLGALGAFVLAGAFLAVWLLTHALGFALGGGVLGAIGIILAVMFSGANSRRARAIAGSQIAAEEASALDGQAAAALAARCRAVGCPNVTAVRAARTAQLEIEKVRVAREGASEAARSLSQRRDALVQRLDDIAALERDRRIAAAQAEDRKRALDALLDALSIASGPIDGRVASYKQLRGADELAAHADAAAGNARAHLERALAGSTVEALEDEADHCAAQAATGGDPGEFADRSEPDLTDELAALDSERRQVERSLDAIRGRVAEFDSSHCVPVAELEERAQSAVAERDRLRGIRAAIDIATEMIEKSKDAVHKEFTPALNEIVGKIAGAITDGRYSRAWIDPKDFAIRVIVPEAQQTETSDALSSGTAQQLRFGLMMAFATTLGRGERVPILVDDALANSDDARAESALLQAAALARNGQQILFFTHREALEARASSHVGVTVLRLDGPVRDSTPPAGEQDHVRYDSPDSARSTPHSEAAAGASAQPAAAGTPPSSGMLPGFST